MADRLLQLGVVRARINVIPNWCNDELIVPVDPSKNPLREKWDLRDKFVVGYSGNLGRAHEFETVLAAAERLRNRTDIVFLFIGSGHRMTELSRRVAAQGLSERFRFRPYQDDDSLKFSLSVADAHWVSLRPELEGLLVPSKFYGIAAAGRPVIAVTAHDGEIARLVTRHKCGIVVAPGEVQGMAKAIDQLATNKAMTAEMGCQARRMLDNNFSRRHAFERWHKVIDKTA
jgi:glycosyltransferase involved in cell wall biosynthesis